MSFLVHTRTQKVDDTLHSIFKEVAVDEKPLNHPLN